MVIKSSKIRVTFYCDFKNVIIFLTQKAILMSMRVHKVYRCKISPTKRDVCEVDKERLSM